MAAQPCYLISRSSTGDTYEVWDVDPDADELLTAHPVRDGASFDRAHQLIAVGNHLLEWGPVSLEGYAPCYPYRLFQFDPKSDDPLAPAPPPPHGSTAWTPITGAWPKGKFWGTIADFGNPNGASKSFQASTTLELIALPNFVLNLIRQSGRTTFTLFPFDPNPPAVWGQPSDPLPRAPQTLQASLEAIGTDNVLLPLGNYVLDWKPATGEYRVWSFDPQVKWPLSWPPVQEGTWPAIGPDHRLTVVGEHVLDWQPGSGQYALWRFDPASTNPLVGPVREGTLPSGFDADTTLLAVEPIPPLPDPAEAAPGSIAYMRTRVKHVVYYMLENRSFDHVLGWLYANHDGPINVVGPPGPFDGASASNGNLDRSTGKVVPQSLYNDGRPSTELPLELLWTDPYHDNSDVLRQMFGDEGEGYAQRATPDMSGFVWNNGFDQVMEGYGPEQLPVINGLAREFAVSDAWFSAHPGATDANRAMALTGSTLGQLDNFMSGVEYQYWPYGRHRPSVYRTLWSNGITDWKIYNSILWYSFVVTYQLFLSGEIAAVDASVTQSTGRFLAGIDQFKEDALTGKLPRFSFLEPVWIGNAGTSSYHPGMDLVPGERMLNDVYEALRTGPGWEETVLVVTFDEHGGLYDHVPPPYAARPWPNDQVDGFRFDLMGPRVPSIVVSPYVTQNTVFRADGPTAYDGTSVIATVLEWFGVPRSRWGLGDRVAAAPTFEGVLREPAPRKDSPTFTPPNDSLYPPGGATPGKLPITDLHRLMTPRLVWALSDGKRTPAEAKRLADEILESAGDLAELARSIEALNLVS